MQSSKSCARKLKWNSRRGCLWFRRRVVIDKKRIEMNSSELDNEGGGGGGGVEVARLRDASD